MKPEPAIAEKVEEAAGCPGYDEGDPIKEDTSEMLDENGKEPAAPADDAGTEAEVAVGVPIGGTGAPSLVNPGWLLSAKPVPDGLCVKYTAEDVAGTGTGRPPTLPEETIEPAEVGSKGAVLGGGTKPGPEASTDATDDAIEEARTVPEDWPPAVGYPPGWKELCGV